MINRRGEPVVALSSGATPSAISVIRLTGDDVGSLVRKCLPKLRNWQARAAIYTSFCEPVSRELLDNILVFFFLGPKSYTGEDMVEIHCHGSSYVVTRILAALHGLGVESAEPGEFTRRAYLNGKLDLAEAEGIDQLIHAQTEHQWRSAKSLASGSLSTRINDLRDVLLANLARVEAQIDFPDEQDIPASSLEEIQKSVRSVVDAIQNLLDTYRQGQIASRGLKVVLFGEPNAGKSTLLNALVGAERALVDSEAGTTRDYIEETCIIEGRLFRLLDTAGYRKTTSAVEAKGIERAKELVRQADLAVFLAATDCSEMDVPQRLDKWRQDFSPQEIFKVRTKADLGPAPWPTDDEWLAISSKDPASIQNFRTRLVEKMDGYTSGIEERAVICSSRHAALLEVALGHAVRIIQSDGLSLELLAFELQRVAGSLSEIVGDIPADQVLGEIFSKFCIGK